MANGHKINARVSMRAKMVAHCRSQEMRLFSMGNEALFYEK
jgi:hypothetical protein